VAALAGGGGAPTGVATNTRTKTIDVANLNDSVSVISERTNTVVATVFVGSFPEAVATNPRTSTIYVPIFTANTVSVINGRTNTVVATIPVGVAACGGELSAGPTEGGGWAVLARLPRQGHPGRAGSVR